MTTWEGQPYTGAHPIKKARTINGPGHELDVRGRNIRRGRDVKGEESAPRRQIEILGWSCGRSEKPVPTFSAARPINNYKHAHHVR